MMPVSGSIDLLVLNAVNKSWNKSLDIKTLLGLLHGSIPPEPWRMHLETFCMEVPLEAVFRFMLAHDLTAEELYQACRSYESPLRRWLIEQLGATV